MKRMAFLLALIAQLPLSAQVVETSPVTLIHYRGEAGASPPLALTKVDPKYTEEAIKAKVTGTILLNFVITAEGLTRNVNVIRKLGYGLDEAALNYVRQWRFHPCLKNGKTVAALANVQINFHM